MRRRNSFPPSMKWIDRSPHLLLSGILPGGSVSKETGHCYLSSMGNCVCTGSLLDWVQKTLQAHSSERGCLHTEYQLILFPLLVFTEDCLSRELSSYVTGKRERKDKWSCEVRTYGFETSCHILQAQQAECGIGDKICSAFERRKCCSVQGVELPLKGYYISCLMLRSGWEHSVWWQGLQIMTDFMSVSLKCKDW